MITFSGIIASLSLIISAFTLFQLKQNSRLSFYSEQFKHTTTLPVLDFISLVNTNDKTRARLILFNNHPHNITILGVKTYFYKPTRLAFLKSLILGARCYWQYVDDARWNPRGNLDYNEHFLEEAFQFACVKDMQEILVTLPEFQTHRRYKFEVQTTVGTTILATTLSHNKIYFGHQIC